MKLTIYIPDEMYERMQKANRKGLNISKMVQEAFLRFEDGQYDGGSVKKVDEMERRLGKIHKLSKCSQSKQS